MKTLRITAALLLTLAAAACSSPTAPSAHPSDTAVHFDGTGYMGGGTRQP